MLEINGWTIFAHPHFLDQLEKLQLAVEKERKKNPNAYKSGANAKLLAALNKLIFETVPADPTLPKYRQGKTLGNDHKHWFRAKFGNSRFRLFFRYHLESRVIVFAWVNDERTLRTYGKKTDAYSVFRKMLDKGNPPDDWDGLLKAASEKGAAKRLKEATADK